MPETELVSITGFSTTSGNHYDDELLVVRASAVLKSEGPENWSRGRPGLLWARTNSRSVRGASCGKPREGKTLVGWRHEAPQVRGTYREEIQRKSRVREWTPKNSPRIRAGVTKKDQKAEFRPKLFQIFMIKMIWKTLAVDEQRCALFYDTVRAPRGWDRIVEF